MTKFMSTRGHDASLSFNDAIFANIAPDGGLYNPYPIPRVPLNMHQLHRHEHFFAQLACALAPRYDTEIAYSQEIYQQQIFPFAPCLIMLHENIAILELFHGPTAAFKDFGATFLSYVMAAQLKQQRKRAIVLTATSGDTGSAVAHAFFEKENIDVVILYPRGRVSALQEQHITSFGRNICAIQIQGSFDDCQRLVKQAFNDASVNNKIFLASANSINIGRLLPQSFYYHFAYYHAKALSDKSIRFCVPSGNFGNLTAGILAQKNGLPVSFIAAVNRNRVFAQYIQSGRYTPRKSKRTISNAMDVGDPSNFERLRALYNNSHARIAKEIASYWISDAATKKTIAKYYRRYRYILDPHSATAVTAAERYLQQSKADETIVCVATAHPSKFKEVVDAVIGVDIPIVPQLASILGEKTHTTALSAQYDTFKSFLLDRFT